MTTDELLALLPEDKQAEVKEYFAGLFDVRSIEPGKIGEALKQHKELAKVWDAELSRKNEDYKKKVENELIPEKLKVLQDKWLSEYQPEKDPEKIRAMIDIEKDPVEKKVLQTRLENVILEQRIKALEKEAETKKALEARIETGKKLKILVEEKKYPIDPDDFADLGDKAVEYAEKIGAKLYAFEQSLIDKYKGAGNTAPQAKGATSPVPKHITSVKGIAEANRAALMNKGV